MDTQSLRFGVSREKVRDYFGGGSCGAAVHGTSTSFFLGLTTETIGARFWLSDNLSRHAGITSSRPTITPSGGSVLRYRFLHERGDPRLLGGSQPLQRIGGWPHVTLVEVRLVAEAERRVPRLELRCCLEEADDLAVLGIRGHPVPESRREARRALFDYSMEPFGHGAVRFPHLGDLRQHGALPLPLASLHLLDPVPSRASFLLGECLAGRGGALGGLLRALLCKFHG